MHFKGATTLQTVKPKIIFCCAKCS